MGEKKEKVIVPAYRIGLAELYLLLRIRMEQTDKRNINGVKKAFFEPETYQNHDKLLKSLTRKKLLEQKDGTVLWRQGLQQAVDVILNSAHCMCFQNDLLRKKDQILSFYYSEGRYAGFLQDKKESLLVCTEDREALYMAFEKILEAKEVSASFQQESWEKLYGGQTGKPVREAMILHSGNRLKRKRRTLAMVSDKDRLYLLGGEDDSSYGQLQRENQSAASWFGVVLRELNRLKQESSSADGSGPKEEAPPEEKSEYRRIVESEGFPRTGVGFWFWTLRKILTGLPGVVKNAAKKKFLSALLYLAWALILFFYNMYATCLLNDTFMLERRAVWGNLTPYLMAGTLRTPSALKGLNVNWGNIDTTFLVWPLMMLATLIGRHLILQIKTRRLAFFSDLLAVPGDVRQCRRMGFGRGRQLWIPFLAVWCAGFLIMNPVTLFLAALYCLLIFAWKDSAIVRFCMLWRCAGNRKKVEAGDRQEPRTEKYRLLFFHMGLGFLIYALISLILWYAVGYHFWIRLIVTMLMAIFALLQIFWPGMMADPGRLRRARVLLLVAAAGMAAAWFGTRYGIVLADDGGWSESGRTLGGLIQNAGFSTILGVTLMTIGLAAGGPAGVMLAVSCLAGAGVFITGCTDTKLGEFVRKSSRQYFFGAEDGEKKTGLCTAVEWGSFLAGFLNPAAGSGGLATKLFYGGKLVTDTISLSGDLAVTGTDLVNFVSGTGDVSVGDLFMDALGMSLDICGAMDDVADAKDIFRKVNQEGSAYQYAKDAGLLDQYKDIQNNRNQEVSNMQTDVNTRRQAELDLETSRHNQKRADIEDTIRRVRNGQTAPPANVDSDTYLRELDRSLGAEDTLFADTLSDIRGRFAREAQQLEKDIQKRYGQKMLAFWDEAGADLISKGYSTQDIIQKMRDYIISQFSGDAGAEIDPSDVLGTEIDPADKV